MNLSALSGPLEPRGQLWVVDDSSLERELTRRAVGDTFDVVTFAEGTSMLEALASESYPDLLLLDWEMPVVSGREVCLFVRERAAPTELPILILTASSEALVDGLNAGANDYVTKPFRAEELNARVATLVALRRAHARVIASDQALRAEAEFRERFIGILAHDLRQPLNTLLMAIQVLSQAPGGADVAARGQRAARRMHRMVEELLDFTRSRVGGGMPISPVQADLAEIVRRVVSDRSEKDLVSFETLGDTRGSWDADRIAQVCSNLIGNAIEHGAPHRPIRVRLVGLPNGITLDVHNEGPAIAADALATLFDPFRGVSQRAPRSGHPGLGLGLYIVDQIVRAHGGSMDVETGDDGTTFRVHLPGHAMHPTTAAERKT